MNPLPDPATAQHAPIRRFSGSHHELFVSLRELKRLPALADAVQQARAAAEAALALFERAVPGHHADEEKALFVAVTRSAQGGPHEARVDELVSRLTAEHRRIERLWTQLRPDVRAVAAGKPPTAPNFAAAVQELVRSYMEHACLEEEAFLPLAEEILARNPDHMAALDLSLHIRHAVVPSLAYL